MGLKGRMRSQSAKSAMLCIAVVDVMRSEWPLSALLAALRFAHPSCPCRPELCATASPRASVEDVDSIDLVGTRDRGVAGARLVCRAGVTRAAEMPTSPTSPAPNIDCVMLDPVTRYDFTGYYDAENYDRDREKFPFGFDENGWLLFGSYDPYCLYHPITGHPWYEAPRISTQNEPDQRYFSWFRIAEQFANIENKILELCKSTPRRGADVPEEKLSDHLYRTGTYVKGKEAGTWGNLDYISGNRDTLTSILESRELCMEPCEAWGEYCAASQVIISSFKETSLRRRKI